MKIHVQGSNNLAKIFFQQMSNHRNILHTYILEWMLSYQHNAEGKLLSEGVE